ncbi:dynamin family protein [Polyangium fumosum]|uniref:Dynamin N-terminal domain-containing protein n=1 Tax=Polyangium fumosum TaxID=889272 RepID=A0A4U1J3R1_9BACT|nr:dynamin family protein [Polyangium fumosum]TKD01685.1 hypothetical protein E8A74_30540 [Polyangium fumosum]
MSDLEPHIDRLLAWYTTRARPFLEQHAPLSLESIDKRRSDVEKLSRSVDDEVAVCFLGDAGVGKSTLLNAIVSPDVNVLPHGGIGPLTAQATVVRYAENPYFRATYLSKSALNRILFALARTHELAQKRAERASFAAELGQELDEEDRREAESALPVQEADAPAENGKLDAYKKQVRLLIQGSQEGELDLPYLIEGLCAALGQKPRFGLTIADADATRIERIRQCLQVATGDGVHRERRADGDRKGFLAELREHASGFLAPLIKSLEVGWNSEALRGGLVLVDLPGVGVANDEYRKVTSKWVRTHAQAVVLVVGNRGVTEASAELLRSTGFLARMLHDSHDPSAKLASLSVAVVKVDEIAESDWLQEKSVDPEAARKWNVHFRENCERAVRLAQQQMRAQLEKLVADGPQATLDERREAVARILETMQVHAVSAPQYRLFKKDDDEAPPRIKSAEESRMPELVTSLQKVAEDHRGLRKERAKAAAADFQKRVFTVIDLVRAQWEENARAEKEAQELREELETFLAPKQRELDARQGAFREFLRESIPKEIEARIAEAALAAQVDIGKQLRTLGDMHWATLRATVRKGGAHETRSGKHVDLPNHLATRFEEPVASVWSKHILTELRKRTKELGADYVGMVGEVVAWARGQEARVKPRIVEALHESLDAQTKELATVGKDAVDDLKNKVRNELHGKLIKKVRQSCEKFVEEKKDVGPGVKQRILDHFRDELAETVVEGARPVAAKVLLSNYKEVQQEIGERLSVYRNPLEAARDAIVQSHEDGVRRSDAQKRRHVLEEIETILAEVPRGDA